MNGILNILKPTGMSSHDVVSFVRRTLGLKKVGHAGTLDPNVSGVLPICVGKATKISDILINSDKEYLCELRLGKSTDTQDSYGTTIEELTNFNIDCDYLISVINSFVGCIKQIPPAYSAVKFNGKKLYEYARQDIFIEKEAREAHIKSLDIIKISDNSVLFKVKCSKGTYMRTLCHDIGIKLGIPSHMGILIRTEAKGLKIEDAITLEDLKSSVLLGNIKNVFIPIDVVVPMKKIIIDEIHYEKLLVGNEVLYLSDEELPEKFYIYCKDMIIGTGHEIFDFNKSSHLKKNMVLNGTTHVVKIDTMLVTTLSDKK